MERKGTKKEKAGDEPQKTKPCSKTKENENDKYITRNLTHKECQHKPPHQPPTEKKSKQQHATLQKTQKKNVK